MSLYLNSSSITFGTIIGQLDFFNSIVAYSRIQRISQTEWKWKSAILWPEITFIIHISLNCSFCDSWIEPFYETVQFEASKTSQYNEQDKRHNSA